MKYLLPVVFLFFAHPALATDDIQIVSVGDEEGNVETTWVGFWLGRAFLTSEKKKITIYFGPKQEEVDRVKDTEEIPSSDLKDCDVYVGLENFKISKALDYRSELAEQILSAINEFDSEAKNKDLTLIKIRDKILLEAK